VLPDGAYHIMGEDHFVRGRYHHLIAFKQSEWWHIYDYAGDGGYKFPKVGVCNRHNLEYSANKV
jgi:hypothetical protein